MSEGKEPTIRRTKFRSSFVWCKMHRQFKHIDVCTKVCEYAEGCGDLLDYLNKANGKERKE